ncbi:(E)-beta-ocimene synthase, chloroplastic [Artemisia annua]|uniref:(E)-beta-ocimene synthase, chloroplastic n=1 Tax=Artemisia annua TaxID=35608 RepID=A0A2U1NTK3_ARTAN|nr:(E)-beta-ocimene synthase, chloroplastic [Artemisia annua]
MHGDQFQEWFYLLMATLVNQDVKDDAIESLKNCHDLFKWSSMLFRHYNDLAALSEVASEHIKNLIDKAWMKMIEAQIACSEDTTDPLIDMAINLARVSNCTYQYGDGIKAPEVIIKDRVMFVIIEPITISEKERS